MDIRIFIFLNEKPLYFLLGLCDYSDKLSKMFAVPAVGNALQPQISVINFSEIILPPLTETLFFSSIDSFFLLFPFLLRTNVRWLEFR